MRNPSKTEHATEAVVWRVFNELEEKLEEIEKKNGERHSKVMDVLDHVMGQFKKFDEEREVLTHRVSDNTDRIEKLESETLTP